MGILSKLWVGPDRSSAKSGDEVFFHLYRKLFDVNKELAAEVERRLEIERQLAASNRVLLEHNRKLREMIAQQVWINDTAQMVQDLTNMVRELGEIIEVSLEK